LLVISHFIRSIQIKIVNKIGLNILIYN
jgi:hypothetical protein